MCVYLSLSLSLSLSRVWRYRGGRCGHESLSQFMAFIGDSIKYGGKPVYLGVATFALPASLKEGFEINFKVYTTSYDYHIYHMTII